ncbi:hypothetical protein QJS10_CPA16g00038 [Acorus calamus]|uniref:Uncharacterized protein n=1 Tax=Acorus calamus TaxID=4465 RepID=A0AAV9CZ71_ACOCL|nr:hypothetical protein QJS10_CPA16g00038 [Acorus calamus]
MAKLVFITLQLLLTLAIANTHFTLADEKLQSKKLCRQCSGCKANQCPASESYPHMTAWDNSLIAGALQSDYVPAYNRGVYSVPDIKGGTSKTFNSYYGWESTSGSASGFHSTGKCLTVFGGNTNKRVVGVAECKLDGSNPYQLFAFRFHYHKAFCCCGLHNE